MAYSAGLEIGIGVDAHDAEHFAGRLVDGDECHGARVIDLGEARDEGVAEFLDRGEEAQAQILLRHGGKERRIQCLVFRPDRTHQKLPCRPAASGAAPIPSDRA